MTRIPPVVPRLPVENPYRRDLAAGSAFVWLRDGWRDLMIRPGTSLARGAIVFLISVAIVLGLAVLEWDHVLFPALAGFLILAPILSIGLYAKSRAIEHGELAVVGRLAVPRGKTGTQLLFIGALLDRKSVV